MTPKSTKGTKVLIVSASAGAGHQKAAEAIHAAFTRFHPSVEAVHIDILDYVTPWFRKFYLGSYYFTINRVPFLWGFLYKYSNRKNGSSLSRPFINKIQAAQAGPFRQFIDQMRPDLIITTHFLPPQILSQDKNWSSRRIPLMCVVTDYEYHDFWFERVTDRYFVAKQSVVEALVGKGVPKENILLTGIPIHPKFTDPLSRENLLRSWGLKPDYSTILVLAGGLGIGDIEKNARSLFHPQMKLQIITVSGKNAQMRERLSQIHPPANIELVNLGFVDNVQELLTAADIVITKAGGLSVSECLAKGTATLMYPVIPGQEENNARYLESEKAAIWIKSFDQLAPALFGLLSDSAQMTALKEKAKSLGRSRAAQDIVADVLQHLDLPAPK